MRVFSQKNSTFFRQIKVVAPPLDTSQNPRFSLIFS